MFLSSALPVAAVHYTTLRVPPLQVFALINATERLGPGCADAYPGDEGWKCLFGEYRVPFLRTPYLMSASQFDHYQLPCVRSRSPLRQKPCS